MSFYDEIQEVAGSILNEFKQGSVKLIHYEEASGGTLDEPTELVEEVNEGTLDEPTELVEEVNEGTLDEPTELVEEVNEGTLDEPTELVEEVYDLDATVSGVSYKYLINSYAVASDLTVTAGVIKGVTPSINDFIEIEGVRHKIIRDISAAPNAANGKPVVWRFICRKG